MERIMQIGIVGDLHLGPKCQKTPIKDAVVAGEKALHKMMIEDFRSRGIKTVLFSGDVFTVHAFMTIDVMAYAIQLFRDEMRDFDIHVIAGNHDYVYENRDSLTSLQLLELLPNVHVYRTSIVPLELLGKKWYMVPWIFPDKMEATSEWLSKLARQSKAKRENTVLFGHFDIMDMLMEAGQISSEGLPPEKFYKAACHTFSGHYHCRSYNKGKDADSSILYMGTPYHLSFAHVGTDCGYYILDDKMDIEFVENKVSPRFIDVDDEHLEGLGDLSNCIVRYFSLNGRNFDEAVARKKVLMDAHPIYVNTVCYGGAAGGIDDARRVDDEEARKLLGADNLTMASMYMDKYPEQLPTFWSGEDPKKKIMQILSTYGEKI